MRAIEFTRVFEASRENGGIILALGVVTLEICGHKSPLLVLPTCSPFSTIGAFQVPLMLELSPTIDTTM